MSRNGLGQTTLSGMVKRTTDKAVLFTDDRDGAEYWIPRRICIDGDNADEGDTDLVVADWWLKQEGRD